MCTGNRDGAVSVAGLSKNPQHKKRVVAARSFNRPLGEGSVDFGHDADGFLQGRDDFAVVLQVFVDQGAAPAVFEPLLANLIAADVEIPDFVRHTFEVLATWPFTGRACRASQAWN